MEDEAVAKVKAEETQAIADDVCSGMGSNEVIVT